MKSIISHSEKETMDLAQKISQKLCGGDVICLQGDLGSGKTTFVKGVAKGKRISPKRVNSPTFVLMNIYEAKSPLYHFDLYRLEDTNSIRMIGVEEFLYGDGITLIEWAERLGELRPKEYLDIHLAHRKDGGRSIKLTANGKRYKQILDGLKLK